jgi:SAM-dependent methyltransferase
MSGVYHDRETYGRIAWRIGHGLGLELGALHSRFDVPGTALIGDRWNQKELERQYVGDSRVDGVWPVQLVTDAGSLGCLADSSMDFVLTSHVMEHLTNPGMAIEEWCRVVRPGGSVYFVVPDKRFCFDRRRAATPVSHLMEEYAARVQTTSIEHYEDFIFGTEGEDGIKRNPTEDYVRLCFEKQTSIHVHTFTADSLLEFLVELRPQVGFRLALFEAEGLHLHCVLEPTG